jgi:hypothetical protein
MNSLDANKVTSAKSKKTQRVENIKLTVGASSDVEDALGRAHVVVVAIALVLGSLVVEDVLGRRVADGGHAVGLQVALGDERHAAAQLRQEDEDALSRSHLGRREHAALAAVQAVALVALPRAQLLLVVVLGHDAQLVDVLLPRVDREPIVARRVFLSRTKQRPQL